MDGSAEGSVVALAIDGTPTLVTRPAESCNKLRRESSDTGQSPIAGVVDRRTRYAHRIAVELSTLESR